MIGGGSAGMRPGEISLAHGGLLFLDEMGEFPATVLDALRQPLEDGEVRVSRARGVTVFPARFLLVAAMNPCPCGQGGSPGTCRCATSSRERYVRRLSGPLLDRFDLSVPVAVPGCTELLDTRPGESSAAVAARVVAARRRAADRGVPANAQLRGSALEELVPLDAGATAVIERELRSGALTARGLHRVRRLARTLADLDGVGDVVGEAQVIEALFLRSGRDQLTGESR
jgi:magnesium chelatase family protein